MELIEKGIEKGLIKFDDDRKYITYVHQNTRRNYSNPEGQVQAKTFLKLILDYNYKPERIKQFETVIIGASAKVADIIVYNNDEHTSAHIVVECKPENASELLFKTAIKQAFSYAATGTVRAKYFWVTTDIKDAYFQIPEKEPKKYLPVPDIPQNGVTELAKFKYAKGGGRSSNGQKLSDLQQVTESQLTLRFKQAHDSLWAGGELNPSEAFDELDKLIFCKIWDEDRRNPGDPYHFQIFSENTEDETNRGLQKRINALYADGRKKDPEVFKDDIRLSPEKLRTVVGYLEAINLGDTDLDSKGRAFETFMDSFFRGDFGQYFTPRPIVKFIVDTLPITRESLVLDTSCGSGGFLLHALNKVRQQANTQYTKGSDKHHKYWHDFAEHNLFGIEINEQIARTAKMNMIIHDDGHTNVIAADGLLPVEDIKDEVGNVIQEGIHSKTHNRGFVYNRFDFIITNPPFGSRIKQTEQAYMSEYSYAQKDIDWLNPTSKKTARDNQNTEILFIEQCHKYLTEHGYLAIVIPDGILTNSSLQYVRDDIEGKYRIVAVISMPSTAFQATGAGVKSSVLFLRKHTAELTEKIKNQKIQLQDSIKEDNSYKEKLEKIHQEKKLHIKDLVGFDNSGGLKEEELNQLEKYKEWKSQINAKYKEQIDALKESLNEEYIEKKRKRLKDFDYPIFMAIAEDIGYDATGKETGNNELEIIGPELTKFIQATAEEEV